MKKYLTYSLLIILAIILMPKNAYATDVKVVVTTGPYANTTQLYTYTTQVEGTTIADIKQVLSNQGIDPSEYYFDDGSAEYTNDYPICANEGDCYDMWDFDLQQAVNTFILHLIPYDDTEMKVTFNSIPAVNDGMMYFLSETQNTPLSSLMFVSCNSTFTQCIFNNFEGTKSYTNVKISYNYDSNINSIAQDAIDKGLMSNTSFNVTDVEFINWMNYGGDLANYSSEFKNQMSNLNFTFVMDERLGSIDYFETMAGGFYQFLYDGILYGFKDYVEVYSPHVIYISDDATDEKQALENRLEAVLGENNHLTVTESTETANEFLDNMGEIPITGGDRYFYTLTYSGPNPDLDGMEYYVFVEKDSSKVNNDVSFKSKDLITGLSVEASGDVPLDTLVKVNQITSGTDYDKIINVLDVEEAEMFEINLHSNSQERNITTLPNGKFLVKIKIPEKYNGKELVVYYVDQDDNVTEYTVTPENGYATFEADHFSIYSLVLKKVTNTNTNTNSSSSSASTSSSSSATTTSTTVTTTETTKEETTTDTATKKSSNPKTNDSINIYIGLMMISLLGLGFSIKKIKTN